MKRLESKFGDACPRSRLLAALGAATATTMTISALLLAFDSASPRIWLQIGPEVASAVAACDAQVERQLRDHCKQQLAETQLTPGRQPTRMAAR